MGLIERYQLSWIHDTIGTDYWPVKSTCGFARLPYGQDDFDVIGHQ